MSVRGFRLNGVVHKYAYDALDNKPTPDTTLTESGKPADSKAVGDAISEVRQAVGSPLVAATAAAMTDTSKIYVYTGSESGYTSGNWYYYNGTSWVSGGVYNSSAVETDKTLSVSDKAADAKTVGDRIAEVAAAAGTVDAIAPEFELKAYSKGDLVFYENVLYQANKNTYPVDIEGQPVWPSASFDEVTIDDVINGDIVNLIARRFINNEGWIREVGTYVVYGDKLYRVTEANSDTIWNASKYVEVASIGAEMNNIKSSVLALGTTVSNLSSDLSEAKDDITELKNDFNDLKSAVTDLDDGKIYINPNKGTWYKGYFDSTGAFIADQGNAAPENTPILFKAGDVLNIKPNEMNVQIRTYTYSGGVYTQISNTVYTTNQVIKFTDDIYVSIHANKTGVVTITTADITCDIYKDSETKKYIDSQVSDVEDRVDEQISDIEDHVDEQIDLLAPTIEEQITQTIAHTDFTSFGNKTVSADGDFYDNDSYYSYIYQFDKAGKFYVNNFGNSSYGFIATYSGYPSKSTFITRNYNGTTPSEMGKIDVTAGQYVFVSVNLLSTIVFNTYLDYTANTQPTLFRREMKIAWFGDSISQLQLLPHRVGNNIGCTVYDCSFAGSALTFGSTRYGGMSVYSLSGQIASGNFTDLETSLDNQEADHIDVTQKRINAATLEGLNFDIDVSHVVIMGGTNDLNNDYVTTSSDLTAFKGAVQDIIDNFNTSFPHIRLAFISDPYRGDITPTNPDKYGHSLIDINEAIQEVCEANNIVFYDLYHCSGINANTVGYYLMNDQLHQTEAGDILLAEKCAKWLEAN